MSVVSQFQLTNVLGTIYTKGNLVFTPKEDTLIAPVGNKITFYDLSGNKSTSLCFESTHNYAQLAISPSGYLLIAVNEIGVGHCIALKTQSLLRSVRFGMGANGVIGCIRFSPDGNYIAVGKRNQVTVYRSPSDSSSGSEPFEMVRVFKGLEGIVEYIDWSFDSELLVAGSSRSPVAHVFAMKKYVNFKSSCFSGSDTGLVGVYFDRMEYHVYTFYSGAGMCKWDCSTEPELWKPEKNQELPKIEELPLSSSLAVFSDEEDDDPPTKRFKGVEQPKNQLTKFHLYHKVELWGYKKLHEKPGPREYMTLTCVECDSSRAHAVLGFKNGTFLIIGLPAGEFIHTLSVTEHTISTVTFSPNGEWIAIGAGAVGQLIVWEWLSESYVMKQQGHLDTIHCLDISTDGRWIVTGAHDGKVKLWETKSSHSFHTYSDHDGIITGVVFTQNNKAVLSASFDGTVRASDTVRYRNFRIFTTPKPVQFSGVSVDSSGSYVASGSIADFNVFVWHMNSGRLLLEIPGHTGPVTSLCFNPKQGSSMLASISWDKTLRIRDSIETDSNTEVIALESEGTALAFRPDGKEIAVSTTNGCITFIDPDEHKSLGTINGKYHMAAGRLNIRGDSVDKAVENCLFNSVGYSADGAWLLAGGKSVNLCIYNATHQVIVHKKKITQNRSLDGTSWNWTAKRDTEFGIVDMLKDSDSRGLPLPGTKRITTTGSSKPEVKVYATKFSPTGLMWAAATTEGVLLYSLNSDVSFNPIGATMDITPQTIAYALKEEHYDAALFMALRLNVASTTTMVLETIPPEFHYAIAQTTPLPMVKLCLLHLASVVGETRHIEFHLMFMRKLLQLNLHRLIEDREFVKPMISAIQKTMNGRVDTAVGFIQENKYLTELSKVLQLRTKSDAWSWTLTSYDEDKNIVRRRTQEANEARNSVTSEDETSDEELELLNREIGHNNKAGEKGGNSKDLGPKLAAESTSYESDTNDDE